MPHPQRPDARVCKAEVHADFLSRNAGAAPDPQGRHPPLLWVSDDGEAGGAGDDGALLEPYIRHIVKEKHLMEHSVGRFLYNLLELLISRDLHRLEEIEDHAGTLEERVLAGELEDFSAPMSALRKEAMAWYRYYSQLDDVACELRENENGFFSQEECGLFRLFGDRVIRLREESQLLREYCGQIQSLFQSEIDIRQNRIMQILTIVTTIFLPLSLVAGWYGMNFSGMPELRWRYGYPAHHCGECRHRCAEPVDLQEEKILVKETDAVGHGFARCTVSRSEGVRPMLLLQGAIHIFTETPDAAAQSMYNGCAVRPLLSPDMSGQNRLRSSGIPMRCPASAG